MYKRMSLFLKLNSLKLISPKNTRVVPWLKEGISLNHDESNPNRLGKKTMENDIDEVTGPLEALKISEELKFDPLSRSPRELVEGILSHREHGITGVKLENIALRIDNLINEINVKLNERGIKVKRIKKELQNFVCFISYRVLSNADIARALHGLLRFSFPTFLDKVYLKEGANWESPIVKALTECNVFLPIISNDALLHHNYVPGTDNLLLEYQAALKLGKIIIPIIIDSFDDRIVSYLPNTVRRPLTEPIIEYEEGVNSFTYINQSKQELIFISTTDKILNLDQLDFLPSSFRMVVPAQNSVSLPVAASEADVYVYVTILLQYQLPSGFPRLSILLLNKRISIGSKLIVPDEDLSSLENGTLKLEFLARFNENLRTFQFPIGSLQKPQFPQLQQTPQEIMKSIFQLQGYFGITLNNLAEFIDKIIYRIKEEMNEKKKTLMKSKSTSSMASSSSTLPIPSTSRTISCFISYRELTDSAIANLLYGLLRHQYKVSLQKERESLNSLSLIEEQQYSELKSCDIFIPIISNDALLQHLYLHGNDSLFIEYELALKRKKIIIPIFLEGFHFHIVRSLPSRMINSLPTNEPFFQRMNGKNGYTIENKSNQEVIILCTTYKIVDLDSDTILYNSLLFHVAANCTEFVNVPYQELYITILTHSSNIWEQFQHHQSRIQVIVLNKRSPFGTVVTIYKEHLIPVFTLREQFLDTAFESLESRKKKAIEYATIIKNAINDTNKNGSTRNTRLGNAPEQLAK